MMMMDDDDEQWLRDFVAPLQTEYERQTAESACIAPARFWQVACRIESWSAADQAHLASCVRCAEHARKSLEAIVSGFGGVPVGRTELERTSSDETAMRSAASGETVLSPEARREQALRRLSEEHRRLIQWRDFDGLSSDEVARRLGWTRQQVVDQLSDARVEFQEALAQVGLIASEAAEPTNASVVSPPNVV